MPFVQQHHSAFQTNRLQPIYGRQGLIADLTLRLTQLVLPQWQNLPLVRLDRLSLIIELQQGLK